MAAPLESVEAANSNLRDFKSDLIGVFVGGTAGIGEATLMAFAKHARTPKIYLVGRNESSASNIMNSVKKLNTGATIQFIKEDTSLLKNVDRVCNMITSQETKINILFMSQGYLTLQGRNETTEGLDKKLCLNYYSRMRFVYKLMPQLTAAAEEPSPLSRVVSILAAGTEHHIIEDDLELKKNFSLLNCSSHAVVMTDLAFEELAKKHTGTSFLHVYPGYVRTGIFNNSGLILKLVSYFAKFFLFWLEVPITESGERNLFYSTTSQLYTPQNRSVAGSVAKEGDVTGKGAYLLNWDGKPTGVQRILRPLREREVGRTVWEHTLTVFTHTTGHPTAH